MDDGDIIIKFIPYYINKHDIGVMLQKNERFLLPCSVILKKYNIFNITEIIFSIFNVKIDINDIKDYLTKTIIKNKSNIILFIKVTYNNEFLLKSNKIKGRIFIDYHDLIDLCYKNKMCINNNYCQLKLLDDNYKKVRKKIKKIKHKHNYFYDNNNYYSILGNLE